MNISNSSSLRKQKHYTCGICNYKTNKKSDFTKHNNTIKHLERQQYLEQTGETYCDDIDTENPINVYDSGDAVSVSNKKNKLYLCLCGKSYSARNSLFYHKKKCDFYQDIHSHSSHIETDAKYDIVIDIDKDTQDYKPSTKQILVSDDDEECEGHDMDIKKNTTTRPESISSNSVSSYDEHDDSDEESDSGSSCSSYYTSSSRNTYDDSDTSYSSNSSTSSHIHSSNGSVIDKEQTTTNEIDKEEKTYSLQDIGNHNIEELKVMFSQIIKDNKQLQSMILTQNKKLMKMALQPKNVTNIKNQNNTFNLIQFLNVECKNAMNFTDFVNNIKIGPKELECLQKHGFVKSFESIVVKELNEMDQSERPIHCLDQKRKKFAFKDDDIWNRDNIDERFKHLIDTYSSKQAKEHMEWREKNPNWQQDDEKYEQSMFMNMEIFKPYNRYYTEQITNKIISEMAKLIIDKQAAIESMKRLKKRKQHKKKRNHENDSGGNGKSKRKHNEKIIHE